MEQITQEQIYTKENNKAKIGLTLGIISLLAWLSGFVSLSLGGGASMFFGLLIMFAIVAVIGIILAILGFKAHKVKATFGIIFCLLGIVPLFVLTQFMYQIGELGNTVYKETDFSIEIPSGWVKVNPTVDARSLRAYFVPKQDSGSYQPRIFITSAKNETTVDLSTFSSEQEKNIKAENNFISGKIMPDVDGKTFYVINYTFDNNGNKIRGIEFLLVRNGVGYSVNASTLESSWDKYKTALSKAGLSLTILTPQKESEVKDINKQQENIQQNQPVNPVVNESELSPKEIYIQINKEIQAATNAEQLFTVLKKYESKNDLVELVAMENQLKTLSDSQKNQFFQMAKSAYPPLTTKIKDIKEVINGNKATITIITNDNKEVATIPFVKENGIWKITSSIK